MAKKRPVAIFTICQDEPVFLPIWLKYYSNHVDETDLFILNHDSTNSAGLFAECFRRGINIVPIHRNESFNHEWLCAVVKRFQRFLFQSYEAVLFTEVDEIVAGDPTVWPSGLEGAFRWFLALPHLDAYRCTGFEVVHNFDVEPPIDWSRLLLAQRNSWARSGLYSKVLLSRVPLDWVPGFHDVRPDPRVDIEWSVNLRLIHLHRIDFDYCLERHKDAVKRNWPQKDIADGAGFQNRIDSPDELRTWFRNPGYETQVITAIEPACWKTVI